MGDRQDRRRTGRESGLLKTDERYRSWIADVAKRFRQSQLKAAVKVNNEMLRFYWELGRDISIMSAEADYGSGFYNAISTDLKEAFPDIKSFSTTNLKYMRYFYEMYPSPHGNRPHFEDDLSQTENRPQAVDDLEMIFCIPWGHNRTILDKCKGNPDKALFYVKKTLENNWSRAILMNFLDTDLYERQGKAITNFSATLPEAQSELAQACKSKDNVKAQYALEASSQPMGIAVYDINRILPEDYRSSLPTIEEIEAEFSDIGGEPEV